MKCRKCGAEVKYIAVSYMVDPRGVIEVRPEYTRVINDSGRVITGHLRHECPETDLRHECPETGKKQ